MLTARMRVSADYLARANLRLSALAARHYPVLRAEFAEVARRTRSDDVWVRAEWSALAQLAALHGLRPQDVTAVHIDDGGDALLAALVPPGYPKARHVLRSSPTSPGRPPR